MCYDVYDLSIYISVYLSIYLFVYLSIYLWKVSGQQNLQLRYLYKNCHSVIACIVTLKRYQLNKFVS